MTEKKLTVVVLTYNRPDTLKLTLPSILSQEGVDFSVMVLDNASTDETPALVKSFADRDPRVTYVRNEVNIGISRNWNRGFSLNRSPYVSIFHDDDIMLPGFLAETVDALEKHPSAAFAFAQAQFMDQDGNPDGEQDVGQMPEGLMSGLDYLELTVDGRGTGIYPPSIVHRASAAAEVWPFDSPHTRGYLDIASYNRIAARHDVYFIRKELVQCRIHTGSDTELLNRECGGTPWYGEISARIDSIAPLLRSPRAADPKYRDWLAERLLYLHQQCSAAIHPSIPAMYHAWDTRAEMFREELDRAVPRNQSFILVDDCQLGLPNPWLGRRVIPFLERDGEYFGPPGDGEQAVAELARMRDSLGVTWIAVAWPCFWWLDKYWQLGLHLRKSYALAHSSPHVAVYSLKPG